MENLQAPERRAVDTLIDVHSIFYTIQGEGPFSGTPAVFIRLAGCNLQCLACFVSNTDIRMGDGTKKKISDIQVGDSVLGYDQSIGQFAPAKVTKTFKRTSDEILRLYTGGAVRGAGNGGNKADLIYCTPEHPFLVKRRGWKSAKHLRIGDVLLHYSSAEHMRRFNSIKKPGALEKVKTFLNSPAHLKATSDHFLAYFASDKGRKTREKSSQRMIENNPMFDPATCVKSFLSRSDRGRKSNFEKRFERIINGLPVRFVGDGSLVVSHKIPDYVVEGQNKLIEIWASDAEHGIWRDDTWIADRARRFKNAGYELLCIPIPDKNIDRIAIRQQVAEYIHNGDTIVSVDRIEKGSKAWIRLAGTANASCDVYNIEVEGLHTYIANSKIVHNCDTEYTRGRHHMRVEDIVSAATASAQGKRQGLVVITGGEPFRQDIGTLIRALITAGFYVQIETNGTLSPPDVALINKSVEDRYGAYIVVSPKGSRVHPDTAWKACAYKYVMDHEHADPRDGLPTQVLGHPCKTRVARPPDNIPVYLQPADMQDSAWNERNVQACIASCMKHGYILQLQTHKLIGMP